MHVGLVQIGNSFSGQHYFPYAVGVLQAYAMKHLKNPQDFEFLLPIYRQVRIADAIALLRDAEIVCFSVYTWNIRLSLAIAEALKRRNPETIIVMGGPQVPRHDRPWEVEEFHHDNPFVDVAIHGMGKGERSFLPLLANSHCRDWRTVPSASFLDSGKLRQTLPAKGFVGDELTELVPSPYQAGVFDSLIVANPLEQWILPWETDRNCPFGCEFCGWGDLEAKPVLWSLEHVYRDIDWMAAHQINYTFCCNANFGLLPRDIEIARYIARVKKETGFPRGLSVQDTKNVKRRALAVRKILREAFQTPVVISLQSVDPGVLKNIRRDNISLSDFFDIQREFTALGIKTMTDLILGLPGETYRSWADGIARVIQHGQHNRIQFNNLSIVPDAAMSHRDRIKQFGLKTVWTRTVNIHGKIEVEEVPEMQELVVASDAMPVKDWVRARAHAYWNSLYFDKLFQIPVIVCCYFGCSSTSGLAAFCSQWGLHPSAYPALRDAASRPTYRELIEVFSSGTLDPVEFPVLTQIRQFFETMARNIQAGGVEYYHAPQWLDVYWPPDEYVFIQLVAEDALDRFYEEVERALALHTGADLDMLHSAIVFNHALLKLPNQAEDVEIECSWNVLEFYRSVFRGETVPAVRMPHRYRIDRTATVVDGKPVRCLSFDEWCEKVVWYMNRAGAYLYEGVQVVAEPVPTGRS